MLPVLSGCGKSKRGLLNIQNLELDKKRSRQLFGWQVRTTVFANPYVERAVWAERAEMSLAAVLRIATHAAS